MFLRLKLFIIISKKSHNILKENVQKNSLSQILCVILANVDGVDSIPPDRLLISFIFLRKTDLFWHWLIRIFFNSLEFFERGPFKSKGWIGFVIVWIDCAESYRKFSGLGECKIQSENSAFLKHFYNCAHGSWSNFGK